MIRSKKLVYQPGQVRESQVHLRRVSQTFAGLISRYVFVALRALFSVLPLSSIAGSLFTSKRPRLRVFGWSSTNIRFPHNDIDRRPRTTIHGPFSKVFLSVTITVQLLPAFGSVRAQDLSLSGYFEHQLFPQVMEDRVQIQDYNKLRLDLSAQAGDRLSFNGDFIFQTYHGATRFNSLDFLPDKIVNVYAQRLGMDVEILRPQFEFKYADEYFLDNAYLSYYGDAVNVRVGKQQLPWGSGYAWNPTDLFHEKNLLDPTYEKRGVNVVKLEVPIGGMSMLTGVIGAGDDWSSSSKALRISHFLAGFDVAAVYVEKEEQSFDYLTFRQQANKRRLIGGDFVGELLGIGLWVEGAYNYVDQGDDYMQVLAGVDYTFENGVYVMSEYYHNGRGASSADRYTMNDWMLLFSAEGENLGRDYLFAGPTYPLMELLDGSIFFISNMNDGSFVIYPYLSYSLNDNTQLVLMGYVTFGTSESEFGAFGPGGIARIRAYF